MANFSNQSDQPRQPSPDNATGDDLDDGDLADGNPADGDPAVDTPLEEEPPHTLEFANLSQQLDQLWPPTATPHSPLAGRRLDQYDLRRVLGSGAFGVVYLAEDTQLRREVALKLPRPEVLVDPEKRQRFESEAALAARLDHPGIVPVFNAKLDGPAPYIASGYCEGPDLAEWLADQSELPAWRDAVLLVAQVADAIHYAHSLGISHRDLKPANILLMPQAEDSLPQRWCIADYFPLVTDFGLSKLADASLNDTRSSLLMGTPLYMAPEQIDRSIRIENEAATDIYGLGVILFELLTGQTPVTGESYVEVLDNIRSNRATPLRSLRGDVPRDLEQICKRCLEQNPEARYPSAIALVTDLRRCLAGEAIAGKSLGVLARFRYWATRPARIAQAGWFAIWTQSIWIVWILVTASVGHLLTPLPINALRELYAEIIFVLFGIHGFCLATGWGTLKNYRYAAWAGFGLSLIQIPGMLWSIVTGPLIFSKLYEGRNQYYAFLIYCMLLMCFSIQTFLFWCATRAQKAKAATQS